MVLEILMVVTEGVLVAMTVLGVEQTSVVEVKLVADLVEMEMEVVGVATMDL